MHGFSPHTSRSETGLQNSQPVPSVRGSQGQGERCVSLAPMEKDGSQCETQHGVSLRMRQATERGSGHEPGERQCYSGRYLSPSLSRTRKVQGSIADQVNRLISHVCTFKATLSASYFPGTA